MSLTNNVTSYAIEDYSEILFEELITASRTRLKKDLKGTSIDAQTINCKTVESLLQFLNWKRPSVLQTTFEYAQFKSLLIDQYKETFPSKSGRDLPLFSVSHLLHNFNCLDTTSSILLENQESDYVQPEWQWDLMTKLNERYKEQKHALMKCEGDSEKLKNLVIIKEIEIENLIRQLASKSMLNEAMREVCNKLIDFIRRQDARLIAVNVVASLKHSNAFSRSGLRRSLPSREALRTVANFMRSSLHKRSTSSERNKNKESQKERTNKASEYSAAISRYFDNAVSKIRSYGSDKKTPKTGKKPPFLLRNTVSCTDSGWASAENQRTSISDAMTVSYISDTLNKFSDELLEDISAFSNLDSASKSENAEKFDKINLPTTKSTKSVQSSYDNDETDNRSIISSDIDDDVSDEFARELNEKLDAIAERLREAEMKLRYVLAHP